MLDGICYLSMIPVRIEPSGKSAMVNQLLFGDRVKIIDKYQDWYRISSCHDGYEGWCEINQIEVVKESILIQSNQLENSTVNNESGETFLVNELTSTFRSTDNRSITLVFGSEIITNNKRVQITGQSFDLISGSIGKPWLATGLNIVNSGIALVGSPYLWGGRSPFGIDCSGLIQIAFKMVGLALPRDAWQQAQHEGEFIDLIAETKPGDIAFFDNDDGKIIHTGILTGEGTIIHACGRVRIDQVDHNGIFNKESGSYSHKLRIIKRFIN